MPTRDQLRIIEDRARPRIMELWWALRPLGSVIRFMNTGAHPDDETTAMLAAMTFRDGINISYACSTRGEGGQNNLGTEAGPDLGALRTREMERACDVLGMRMYWLSEGPDDPITDFGFSKSGVETLEKWGRDRTLARFVEIVRADRPDIICPTFLDVPGQHGHHRAMTEMAHLVMEAAADPGFPSNLPPWQIRKMYLPAWSGAGQSYDDDEPPPAATLTVRGDGGDPVSGWSWERIGQQSRVYHQTQGMGRWIPPGPGRDWPLHLAETHVTGPDRALGSGLPATLADLADVPGAEAIGNELRAADAAVRACLASYPELEVVARHAGSALTHVRAAQERCPEAVRDEIVHRLEAKIAQLGHVLRLALGIEARARTGEVWLGPGDETPLTVEVDRGAAERVDYAFDLPRGWSVTEGRLAVASDAPPSEPYRSCYDPAAVPAPALVLRFSGAGAGSDVRVPFDDPPVVLPGRQAEISPDAVVVNRNRQTPTFAVTVAGVRPEGAGADLDLPPGWRATSGAAGAEVTPPVDVETGLYALPLLVDGAPAMSVRRIGYPHVAPTARARPAVLRARVLDAAVPAVPVGYIGSGNDRVGHWLSALGADVTELDDAQFGSDAALARFGAIVIGIFAMRFRPGLLAAMPRLHRWVENGGTLVTLYHRPWDNWDPERVPPRRIEIGQPSLRWRVTDETAEVRHLGEHPLLSVPNRIGPDDWAGWVKERGLYFAKSWDDAYVPLLEMSDPGEAPLRGALLAADIGRGRHVHTSLILHHQMENLVPGAFRLMANLIAPRE